MRRSLATWPRSGCTAAAAGCTTPATAGRRIRRPGLVRTGIRYPAQGIDTIDGRFFPPAARLRCHGPHSGCRHAHGLLAVRTLDLLASQFDLDLHALTAGGAGKFQLCRHHSLLRRQCLLRPELGFPGAQLAQALNQADQGSGISVERVGMAEEAEQPVWLRQARHFLRRCRSVPGGPARCPSRLPPASRLPGAHTGPFQGR